MFREVGREGGGSVPVNLDAAQTAWWEGDRTGFMLVRYDHSATSASDLAVKAPAVQQTTKDSAQSQNSESE